VGFVYGEEGQVGKDREGVDIRDEDKGEGMGRKGEQIGGGLGGRGWPREKIGVNKKGRRAGFWIWGWGKSAVE